MARFFLSTVVWGEDYIRTFLECGAPALLAPGNLPALAARHQVIHRIVTDRGGEAVLRGSPLIRRIGEFSTITIDGTLQEGQEVPPSEGAANAKYPRWSAVLNRVLEEAWQDRSWVVSWQPDALFSDGSLTEVAKRADAGAEAVCFGGVVIADRARVRQRLAERKRGSDDLSLALPPRDLARLALECRHDGFRCHDLDASDFTYWPSFIYLPVDGEGILVRTFHPSPIAFRMVRRTLITPDDTVDLRFLAELVTAEGRISHITDTDDLCVVNLAESEERRKTTGAAADPFLLGRFVKHWTLPWQRRYARRPIFWHGTDISPDRCEAAVRRSEKFIDIMLAAAEVVNKVPTDP